MKHFRRHLSYANVMSSIAVFLMLGGATAFAATKIGANELKANSIKTGKIVKEAVTAGKLKNGAVTTGKLAGGAVTNEKLADNSVSTSKIVNDAVTGAKANESTFGQVPSALTASNVGGHSASCPANTTLIRGLCFDSVSNPAVGDVFEASDSCREKGGFLPTPMELRSTRDILNLGTGANKAQYTDSIFTNDAGTVFSTMIIEDSGGFSSVSTLENEQYYCVYQLVR